MPPEEQEPLEARREHAGGSEEHEGGPPHVASELPASLAEGAPHVTSELPASSAEGPCTSSASGGWGQKGLANIDAVSTIGMSSCAAAAPPDEAAIEDARSAAKFSSGESSSAASQTIALIGPLGLEPSRLQSNTAWASGASSPPAAKVRGDNAAAAAAAVARTPPGSADLVAGTSGSVSDAAVAAKSGGKRALKKPRVVQAKSAAAPAAPKPDPSIPAVEALFGPAAASGALEAAFAPPQGEEILPLPPAHEGGAGTTGGAAAAGASSDIGPI